MTVPTRRLSLLLLEDDPRLAPVVAELLSDVYDVTLVADGHTTDVGPWPLPLPDGRTVPIGAEQMVAYTNFFVADTEYPGVTTRVLPAAEVSFAG